MPAGTLEVTLHSANGLKDTETLGRQDPYAIVALNKTRFRTRTATDQGTRPVWNEKFTFQVTEGVHEVVVDIYNANILNDDFIGSARIPLLKAFNSMSDTSAYPVFRKSGKQHGVLNASLKFTPAVNTQHAGAYTGTPAPIKNPPAYTQVYGAQQQQYPAAPYPQAAQQGYPAPGMPQAKFDPFTGKPLAPASGYPSSISQPPSSTPYPPPPPSAQQPGAYGGYGYPPAASAYPPASSSQSYPPPPPYQPTGYYGQASPALPKPAGYPQAGHPPTGYAPATSPVVLVPPNGGHQYASYQQQGHKYKQPKHKSNFGGGSMLLAGLGGLLLGEALFD
eukprot:jgi/Chlat1/2643/Chrsp178S02481